MQYSPEIGYLTTTWSVEAGKYLKTRVFSRGKSSFHTAYHKGLIRGLRNCIMDTAPKWWEMVKSGEMQLNMMHRLKSKRDILDVRINPVGSLRAFIGSLIGDRYSAGEKIEVIDLLKQYFNDDILPILLHKKQRMSIGEKIETISTTLSFLSHDLLLLLAFLTDKTIAERDPKIYLLIDKDLANGVAHAPLGELRGIKSVLNAFPGVGGFGRRIIDYLPFGGEFQTEIKKIAGGCSVT